MAALIAIPYSYHSPDTYVDTNVRGALNVVKAARELDVQKVIQTVRGFVSVMESERSIGEVINIGSSFEVSIGDTAKLIAEIMGANLEIETEEERLCPEKAKSIAYGQITARQRGFWVGSRCIVNVKAFEEVCGKQWHGFPKRRIEKIQGGYIQHLV